ncbi:unnamed protein product [Arabidopsis arenosa]|uniref:Succinate dehydrogenase subunit 4 n=1 Tax=Arabidopsis arenosa TaxID=38785 RepID=A0A8S2A9Z1_ARAAE|nr:unnamed protein product [Arabidopsis arenosa]
MSLRRTILDLHRQTHRAALSKSLPFSMSHISSASATAAVRNPLGRDISSIPFALAQKLKPESTNLVTDRSISSSIGQSDINKAAKFSRLSSSRGYTNASFLRKIPILFHIHEGMEEILADYVHQEMTRNLIVISLGLFQIIVFKDIVLFLL